MLNQRWRAIQRARRHGTHGSSAKDALTVLACISLIGSACFWFPAFWRLITPGDWGEIAQVVAWGLFMIAGPPTLVSFLIPWSPAGMLLQRLNAKTWGQAVVIACGIFLLYFSWQALAAWWEMRPGIGGSNLPLQLAIVGVISFIIVPALLWAPVSDEEFAEQMKQAQLVERYKIQTEADIVILRNTLLRAQQQALIGFANLSAKESAELAAIMKGLITAIDQTQQEIAGGLSQATGMAFGVQSIEDNPEIQRLLGQATAALQNRLLVVEEETPIDMSSQQPAGDGDRYVPEDQSGLIAQLEYELAQARAAQAREEARAASQSQRSAIRGASSPTTPPGSARPGTAQPGDATTLLHTIACELPPVFTKNDVARLGSIEPDTARKYLRSWRDQGLVSNDGLPNGTYRLA